MNDNSIMVQHSRGWHETPTGQHALYASRSEWMPDTFYGMIRLLMLAGFCMVCCVQAKAQGLVITDRPMVITERASDSEFIVVVCSTKSCGPCRSFKASAEYIKIRRRFAVEWADTDDRPAWRQYARQVPTVWLIRKSDRKMLRSWVGAVTLTTVMSEISSSKEHQ